MAGSASSQPHQEAAGERETLPAKVSFRRQRRLHTTGHFLSLAKGGFLVSDPLVLRVVGDPFRGLRVVAREKLWRRVHDVQSRQATRPA